MLFADQASSDGLRFRRHPKMSSRMKKLEKISRYDHSRMKLEKEKKYT